MKIATASNILTKSGFIKTTPDATISSVYSQLRSAHDAAFVFRDGEYCGLVNLYYSLLKKRPRSNEKVGSCLYHPPKIHLNTPIYEVARLMVESRVYKLPVFSGEEEFIGVIYVNNILRWALNFSEFTGLISELFPPRNPVYVYTHDGIFKARNIMFTKRINRLLVKDRNEKIVGIISTYDLRKPLSTPVETIHFMSRTPTKKEFGSDRIEKYMNRDLVTLDKNRSLAEAVNQIIDNDVGSTLVLDEKITSPYRLLTNRDLLTYIWTVNSQNKNNINSETFRLKLDVDGKRLFTDRLLVLIKKNPFLENKIRKIAVIFDSLSKKNTIKPIIKIKTQVQTRNQVFYTKAEGKNMFSVLRQITGKLEQQIKKKEKI